MTNQIRRASVSIESNIAVADEIAIKNLVVFWTLHFGSVYEVRTQLFIARDLKYITLETFDLLNSKIIEVSC